MKIDPNASAYPTDEKYASGGFVINPDGTITQKIGETIPGSSGMTIRAEIASRIMAGFAANPNGGLNKIDAEYSVYMADALIAELNKE